MKDSYGVTFSDDMSVLVKCPKKIKGHYIIPDSVTKIGENAFEWCIRLSSVSIPNGVTEIGDWAFCGCFYLTSISIPESITELNESVFVGCSKLTEINIAATNPVYTSDQGVVFNKQKSVLVMYPSGKSGGYFIPDSVTEIGVRAFCSCRSLTSITIPQDVTKIDKDAFLDCCRLTEITIAIANKVYSSDQGVVFNKQKTTLVMYPKGKAGSYSIPNSVSEIVRSAFEGCNKLSSISIPDSVIKIEEDAFQGCCSLTSITIPKSVKEIGIISFGDCIKLTEINVEPDNEVYTSDQGVVFNKQKTALLICPQGKIGSYSIPNGVTTIGKMAFRHCRHLNPISIPESVTEVGHGAFLSCRNLQELIIPNGVATIGNSSFRSCSSLTSITIPSSVSKIGEDAFKNCRSLAEVKIPKGTTAHFLQCGLKDYQQLLVETGE